MSLIDLVAGTIWLFIAYSDFLDKRSDGLQARLVLFGYIWSFIYFWLRFDLLILKLQVSESQEMSLVGSIHLQGSKLCMCTIITHALCTTYIKIGTTSVHFHWI